MEMTGTSVRQELRALVANLQWTWQPEIWAVFRSLDPSLWTRVNHNPMAFLDAMSDDLLERRARQLALEVRLPSLKRRQNEYRTSRAPLDGMVGPLHFRPIAYFSAEFGLHESLPLYSGGLGVLAGDHLKSASDLGVPLVGVGLFYTEGYFSQRIGRDGWQQEEYGRTNIDTLPIQRVMVGDEPLIVEVETGGGPLFAGVWEAKIGRNRLILLDSNVVQNQDAEDRDLTSRLYGGDVRTRIRQEMLLGVGGMRALRALGIKPGVLHLNEGHSAFAPLEFIRHVMVDTGQGFSASHRDVEMRTVFTTHTPVEAGHDRFTAELVEAHLEPLRRSLGLERRELLALGRVDPTDDTELFCMTVLAFKCARRSNGVSAIHGHVSRHMWRRVWPRHMESEIPIGHITNGIHVASFLAPEMAGIFDRYLDTGWRERMSDARVWDQVDRIDNSALWETHNILKVKLIQYLRQRVEQQRHRWGDNPDQVKEEVSQFLRPDALTIGFARRFAAYKRADLLMRDLERLERLLHNTKRPVQILFAGKSHPKDQPAKLLLQSVAELTQDPRFRGRILFIEDYDIGVARHLVQGVDLWLNNPRRPMEACGTSGMKGILNGVLHMSVLDGWWAEAYDGSNGFAIGDGDIHHDNTILDTRDWDSMIRTLEGEVIPMYFRRGEDDIPDAWLTRVKRAMRTLAWRFSSDRMVADYLAQAYLPAVSAVQSALNDRSCRAELTWSGGPR